MPAPQKQGHPQGDETSATRPSPHADLVIGYLGAPNQSPAVIFLAGGRKLEGPEAVAYDQEIRDQIGDPSEYSRRSEFWREAAHEVLKEYEHVLGPGLMIGAGLSVATDSFADTRQILFERALVRLLENEPLIEPDRAKVLSEALMSMVARHAISPLEFEIVAGAIVDMWSQSPTPELDDVDVSLAALHSATLRMNREQQLIDRLVDTCRTFGATWGQIAEAANISRQTAHQRWSERGKENHRLRQARARGRN